MKKLLLSMIRQLGCMTILLFLAGLFFGIFFPEKEDMLVFFVVTGSIAGMIYIISSVIYWLRDPGSF